MIDGMEEMGTLPANLVGKRILNRLPPFPEVQQQSQYGGQRGHVLRMVRNELTNLGYSDSEIDGGGLRITTTFTPQGDDRRRAGRAGQPAGPPGLHVAVASVDPRTGALRGMFAGQDYLKSQLNWAEAGGAPGSTFKPFALAAGAGLRLLAGVHLRRLLPAGDRRHGVQQPGRRRWRVLRVHQPAPGDHRLGQHRLREHGRQHGRRCRRGRRHRGRDGHPAQRPRPRRQPLDRAGLGDGQPDRHGQLLRHHRRRRCGQGRLHRPGRQGAGGGGLQAQGADHPGDLRGRGRGDLLRPAAGRSRRHRHQRQRHRPTRSPARPAPPRPTPAT